MNCTLTEIMENAEFRNLVVALRCGIGLSFDINKLYYKRINIFTDEDIDGFGISASMIAFFYKFMRPVIENGILYKVFTPLYTLDDKEHPYVSDKAEIVEIFHEKIMKNYKLRTLAGTKVNSDEFKEYLVDTYDYRDNLIRSHKQSGRVNKFLIELIVANLVIMGKVRSESDYDDINTLFSDSKFVSSFMSKIQKVYPEIVVDETGRFSGVVEGKTAIIKLSPRFFNKVADLIPVYKKYGYQIMIEEKGKEPRVMTIAEFADISTKLMPKRLRIKGLGELNGEDLFKVSLDINNRISVQYTIEDVERELEIFNMTHGSSKSDRQKRKQMMKNYKIKREDLDN